MVSNILFLALGVWGGVSIHVFMMYIRNKKRNDKQAKNDKRYETVNLDTGKYIIPEYADGDEYNRQVKGYDIHIRENFEQYIRLHVKEWWDEYANNRRKELAPLARTTYKYVKVEPVRLNGSLSTDWYAYVEHGAFKVKVRYITPHFDEPYNMEMRITNTNITETNNEF